MSGIVNRSRLLIGLSMAIFGTIGLFVRGIDLPSSETALFRAVLAVLAIGLFLLATGQRLHFKDMGKELLLLAASGIAMGFNWILLFEAYKYTTISMATLSYYAAPILITLASTFIFREPLTRVKTLCFIMSTAGILLITLKGSDVADTSSAGVMSGMGTDHIGILFGLGAAVLYASVVLLNKLIRNVDGIQRTFLQFVAAVVTLFPYVMLTGGIHLGGLNRNGWILLLIVGLLHTGVAYCMYFSSLQHVPGQEAAVLSYIDPLLAVILSVLVLHEPMNGWQLLGGAMILGFTLLNELL
jgi:drug/metabolite transporter (DMT)-like permease